MNLQKAKVWQSPKYRRFVASLPCCVESHTCSSRDTVVPHHTEGAGRRKRDDLTIPACLYHHDIYHDIHRANFEYIHNLRVEDIIKQTQARWLEAGNKAEWL